MHGSAPVPPIPAHLRVPPEVEAVVRRAMAKEAKDRYADAGTMALALRGAISAVAAQPSRPMSAPPPSAPPVAAQTQKQVSAPRPDRPSPRPRVGACGGRRTRQRAEPRALVARAQSRAAGLAPERSFAR